jgi:methionine salvage enolase-phosphatase E1
MLNVVERHKGVPIFNKYATRCLAEMKLIRLNIVVKQKQTDLQMILLVTGVKAAEVLSLSKVINHLRTASGAYLINFFCEVRVDGESVYRLTPHPCFVLSSSTEDCSDFAVIFLDHGLV